MKNATLLTMLLLYVVACANPENTKQTLANSEAIVVEKIDKQVPSYASPCELITDDEIKLLFSIPSDLTLIRKDRVLTYPTCSFEWEDGKVQKIMESLNMKIDLPSELMIVMVKNSDEKKFEASAKVYKDGVPVKDLGDVAAWGDRMLQLSFLSNGYMFHIHVKASNEAKINKEKAIEIAGLLIDKL